MTGDSRPHNWRFGPAQLAIRARTTGDSDPHNWRFGKSEGLEVELQVPERLEVRFEAPRGAVVAVVGPNGAGKSTLVNALAGLQEVSGHVVLDGRDLIPLRPQERSVGLVFQDQRLFPHLSALDNVAFGPRARGVARREATDRAVEWLDKLGIDADLRVRRPQQLSGGQAQRVAIARALVTQPDFLLLDEPFAGLDVGVAASLRIELARHLADFAGITILVTHDALDALTLATHVLVLDEGRLVQQGSPADVAARPATEHVARLVGLNVIREGYTLRSFTPSSVAVSIDEPTGSPRHRWSGKIRSAAPHGDAIRLQVRGEVDLIADVTPAATRELALAPGQHVWLSVKETAMTTYDVSGDAATH